ncbi:MAG TPA: alpha/beta hydrolase [Stellaceae bacterium]|jgi:pimeloyl-ACP methyl ester carboxylesterase|nr:alpha/beta hydrolase [Stellaceae bacterium]
MPRIRLDEGLSLHCAVDDYLWPWEQPTPVMMLHGFARNATFWNRWVPAIAGSRRIYRPDLLGCGPSDMPAASCHFTPDQIAAQVLAVLDALSLPRVHWVGESSGGLVGLLLAASHPRRIASLVLCNTPTRISNEIRGIYSLDQDSTAAAIRAYGTGEWCRRTLGYRLDLDHASAELREWCVAEMDKTRPDIAAALHECFEGVDVVPVLPEIQAPVLLLSGDKSRIASEQQKILARTLPHGRLELFGGYGHGVNLLLPERCARAALDFWRQVEADGGS